MAYTSSSKRRHPDISIVVGVVVEILNADDDDEQLHQKQCTLEGEEGANTSMTHHEAIERKVVDGYVVVPHDTTPVYMTNLAVYVEGWTAEKEYGGKFFDLYPLANAERFQVPFKVNGLDASHMWYRNFGAHTNEAMKFDNGELVIRDRTT